LVTRWENGVANMAACTVWKEGSRIRWRLVARVGKLRGFERRATMHLTPHLPWDEVPLATSQTLSESSASASAVSPPVSSGVPLPADARRQPRTGADIPGSLPWAMARRCSSRDCSEIGAPGPQTDRPGTIRLTWRLPRPNEARLVGEWAAQRLPPKTPQLCGCALLLMAAGKEGIACPASQACFNVDCTEAYFTPMPALSMSFAAILRDKLACSLAPQPTSVSGMTKETAANYLLLSTTSCSTGEHVENREI